MLFFRKIDLGKIPKHIAFIMDGNGRWAEKRNKPRDFGHRAGVLAVEKIVKYSHSIGIKYLTFFAFSTENWKRPKEETDTLFGILRSYLNKKPDEYTEDSIKVNILGDITKLPKDLQESCTNIIEKTKLGKSLILNIALNYGSRAEILRAVKLLSDKKLEITEQNFSANLYTAGQPDPDLIIRTSGEMRLSNFLLYQSAYSEFYFVRTLWPSFSVDAYKKAILYYQSRKRRFGGTQ